jgi:hypothetical protein
LDFLIFINDIIFLVKEMFFKSNQRIFFSIFEKILKIRYLLLPMQSLMMVFFINCLSEQVSQLYVIEEEAGYFTGSAFIMLLNLIGPVMIFFLGFLPRYVKLY